MNRALWDFWGASIIGPSHIKNGIPNQDAWIHRYFTWGSVLVVSDGLGSKKYSDIGSKAVCHSVIEAAKVYHKNLNANFEDILRLIHSSWLVNISPFLPEDCMTTCLFVIQIDQKILVGQLGDGLIVLLNKSESKSFFLEDDKGDSFSNLTNSLSLEFSAKTWKVQEINNSMCDAIVMCTDGISDDLLQEQQISFASELVLNYKDLRSIERTIDLKLWMKEWPVPGHSDDKTIACMFKKENF